MHADSDHQGGWGVSGRVQSAVLQPVMIRADGGGGLRWPKLMVVAGFVHVGGAPAMSVLG
jgi:hypothetical protein